MKNLKKILVTIGLCTSTFALVNSPAFAGVCDYAAGEKIYTGGGKKVYNCSERFGGLSYPRCFGTRTEIMPAVCVSADGSITSNGTITVTTKNVAMACVAGDCPPDPKRDYAEVDRILKPDGEIRITNEPISNDDFHSVIDNIRDGRLPTSGDWTPIKDGFVTIPKKDRIFVPIRTLR